MGQHSVGLDAAGDESTPVWRMLSYQRQLKYQTVV